MYQTHILYSLSENLSLRPVLRSFFLVTSYMQFQYNFKRRTPFYKIKVRFKNEKTPFLENYGLKGRTLPSLFKEIIVLKDEHSLLRIIKI